MMVNSYEDMMGTPMDVESHPSFNKPTATQHYAGTELPNPFDTSGPTTAIPSSPFEDLKPTKKIKVPRKPIKLPPNSLE